MPDRDAMTLVGALFTAINQQDLDRVTACYASECHVELSFADEAADVRGREAVAAAYAREWATWSGALPGGMRYDVSRVAGIETGWGWVRADFARGLRHATTGHEDVGRAYAYFWVEDGAIRRQRTIVRPPKPATAAEVAPVAAAPAAEGRRYPSKPIVGVGGVIFNDAGEVLLVKRKNEPLALQWSLPGGGLDGGETLESGTAREVREETGLIVEVGPLVEVFDRILLDDEANVRYHFVLVDYLCRVIGGTLSADSDVSECAWVPVARLSEWSMAEKPRDVIGRARTLKETVRW